MAGDIERIVRESSEELDNDRYGFPVMRRFNNVRLNDFFRADNGSDSQDTLDINLFVDDDDHDEFPRRENSATTNGLNDEQNVSTTDSSSPTRSSDSDSFCIFMFENADDLDFMQRLRIWRSSCLCDTMWGGLIVFAICVIFLAVVLAVILKARQ